MRLTPLDIQQKRFGKAFRGYAAGEVEAFLEAVTGELEARIKENLDLAAQVKRQEVRLEELADREKALHDALVAAQRVAESIQAGARKEAELVVVEAQLQAEKIVADARARLLELLREIEDLKRQRASFETRLEGLLDGHRKLLAAGRDEPIGNVTVLPRKEPAGGRAG